MVLLGGAGYPLYCRPGTSDASVFYQRLSKPEQILHAVWIESRGDPEAVGPAGAVGLMQVMPKERGFSWRPTQEALMDPGTNLFWGTRTLATVIRQGKGDVFSALAAYNGGWEKTTSRGPMKFAATISNISSNKWLIPICRAVLIACSREPFVRISLRPGKLAIACAREWLA